ncbi:MAG: group III truncated hemoglobin [Opitutales bacterium]|nr:group III truncated hemoglobin [Opitutales bacterium]
MNSLVALLGDIAGKQEIRLMVDSLYEGIRSDEQLGPVFDSKIADWSKHLPTMYSFWDSILFGTADYRGNPFAKHMNPLVGHAHFKRWIEIFIATVDRLFTGPKAEQAKAAAKSIAHSF